MNDFRPHGALAGLLQTAATRSLPRPSRLWSGRKPAPLRPRDVPETLVASPEGRIRPFLQHNLRASRPGMRTLSVNRSAGQEAAGRVADKQGDRKPGDQSAYNRTVFKGYSELASTQEIAA